MTGIIMAGIERVVAHFRADPYNGEATPMNVIYVADEAAKIDQQLSVVMTAARRVLAWSDRQPAMGARLPPDVETELRLAMFNAERRPS
jgi:hypothetical protein